MAVPYVTYSQTDTAFYSLGLHLCPYLYLLKKINIALHIPEKSIELQKFFRKYSNRFFADLILSFNITNNNSYNLLLQK